MKIMPPKDIFRMILETCVHVALMLLSLSLAYNSYKEYMRGPGNINVFPIELRVEIKETFALSIIIFTILFIIYCIKQNKRCVSYLSIRQYSFILILQAAIANYIFFSNGYHVLIVQNLSLFYLAIFLFVWGGIKRCVNADMMNTMEPMLPPVVYKFLQNNMPLLIGMIKEAPLAHLFIMGSISVFIMCVLLLVFRYEGWGVDQIGNIAYFLLMTGIGIRVYQLAKYGKRD